MAQMGKSHLIIMFTVGPDDVAEGDRIFASHGEFMKGHPREGDVALLDYTVSKGPELSNPGWCSTGISPFASYRDVDGVDLGGRCPCPRGRATTAAGDVIPA